MKKLIIFSFLIAIASLFDSCRKEDNPKLPDLTRFPTPSLTAAAGSGTVITASTAASFTGKVVVDLFFKTDVPPQKYDVVVRKNNGTVKTLKEGITTFPTTVEFTGAQLATLFGEAVKTCDFYDVGVDVTTQSGQKYLAFPATGNSYASGVAAQPGASTVLRYTTKVEFNSLDYNGDFTVVTDEWEDYKVGETVTLTRINDTQVSFKYKTVNASPIIITVDPVTLKTSAAAQVYGNYGAPPDWPYGNVTATGVASTDNLVAPCEKTISIKLNHTAGATNFGDFIIKLKKK